MFGRSVRSTTTSACLPASSEPVTSPTPATRAPSEVAQRITSRVVMSRGSEALPVSLRSNTVACCTEIVPRIWANTSPDPISSSSTPRPGRMSRSISSWIGGAPRPPAISLDGARDTHAPEAAMASRSAPSNREQCASTTSSPSSCATAARPPGSIEPQPPCAWIRSPSSRARPHSSATPSGSPAAGTTDPNASVVVGPAASVRRAISAGSVGGAGSPSRVSRRAAYTKTVRSPESVCACRAASAAATSVRASNRSTTVVMPASTAPSRPIRVAAYTSSDV